MVSVHLNLHLKIVQQLCWTIFSSNDYFILSVHLFKFVTEIHVIFRIVFLFVILFSSDSSRDLWQFSVWWFAAKREIWLDAGFFLDGNCNSAEMHMMSEICWHDKVLTIFCCCCCRCWVCYIFVFRLKGMRFPGHHKNKYYF